MNTRRWLPYPQVSLALLAAWLMLNSTLAPAHLLLGAFLGWSLPLLCASLLGRNVPLGRPLKIVRLLAVVMFDIVIANLKVARLILGPAPALRQAFIEVPLALREPYAVHALASIITLTPGTISSRISQDRRRLLVHALDVPDEQELINDIKLRYEQPLKEIFEC
jgi:multicomponent K+:H+ antiporter subunit E